MGFLSKLFGGNKEKPKCPICGNEMGFFSKTELTDGAICDKCVARAQSLIGSRLISEMSVGAVKAVIDEENEVNAHIVNALSGMYANLFKVETAYPITVKATQVGVARAKAMQGCMAVKGTVIAGAFDKGTVYVIHDGQAKEANLAESVPFDDSQPVEEVMAAHLYKGPVQAVKNAWLIVSEDSGATRGDIIGAK